jgi:hypothetical protein
MNGELKIVVPKVHFSRFQKTEMLCHCKFCFRKVYFLKSLLNELKFLDLYSSFGNFGDYYGHGLLQRKFKS